MPPVLLAPIFTTKSPVCTKYYNRLLCKLTTSCSSLALSHTLILLLEQPNDCNEHSVCPTGRTKLVVKHPTSIRSESVQIRTVSLPDSTCFLSEVTEGSHGDKNNLKSISDQFLFVSLGTNALWCLHAEKVTFLSRACLIKPAVCLQKRATSTRSRRANARVTPLNGLCGPLCRPGMLIILHVWLLRAWKSTVWSKMAITPSDKRSGHC